MTKINLDLSLVQINLLFESLDKLRSYYKINKPNFNVSFMDTEINELIRYIDKQTFGE